MKMFYRKIFCTLMTLVLVGSAFTGTSVSAQERNPDGSFNWGEMGSADNTPSSNQTTPINAPNTATSESTSTTTSTGSSTNAAPQQFCQVVAAEMDPSNDTGSQPEGFYKDSARPAVTVTIRTVNCVGRTIYVNLIEGTTIAGDLLLGEDDVESVLHNKALVVPESGTLEIRLKTGEEQCNRFTQQNEFGVTNSCQYHIIAGTVQFTGSTSTPGLFFSKGKPRGRLAYNCDLGLAISGSTGFGSCDTPWMYIRDNGVGSANNATVLTDGGSIVAPGSACAGTDGKPIPGCYELYSGLTDALGPKFSKIENANSLGELLNAIIAWIIGIGGVLTVVMIMYNGYLYIVERKEGNVSKMGTAKTRIFNSVLGLLLLLTIYTILRTINPDLLNLVPRIDAIDLGVFDRSSDPDLVREVEGVDTSNISITPGDYSDPTFLAYLTHQQGAAGAAAIIWSAKKGHTTVPTKTPFTTGDIQRNIASNCFSTCVTTPAGFLDFWRKKVEGFKRRADALDPAIQTALEKAASETGLSLVTLTTMCRIESYNCSRPAVVNKYGYAGLFQLSNKEYMKSRKKNGVWEDFKKSNGVLLDPYHNAYAAAMFTKKNLNDINGYWPKINE